LGGSRTLQNTMPLAGRQLFQTGYRHLSCPLPSAPQLIHVWCAHANIQKGSIMLFLYLCRDCRTNTRLLPTASALTCTAPAGKGLECFESCGEGSQHSLIIVQNGAWPEYLCIVGCLRVYRAYPPAGRWCATGMHIHTTYGVYVFNEQAALISKPLHL
jgi:hypothetical protein